MKHECKLCGHKWDSEEQSFGCHNCYAGPDDIIVYTLEYRIEKLSDLADFMEDSIMSLEKTVKELGERLDVLDWSETESNYVSLLERIIILEQELS